MRLDSRKIIRFTLIAIAVLYLLDAGVEASKNRKKRHRHRSKRTHGDKPHRHRNHHKSLTAGRVTEPNIGQSAILIEMQKSYHPSVTSQSIRKNVRRNNDSAMQVPDSKPDVYGFSPDVYEQVLREKKELIKQQHQNDDTTVIPVVEAKLEFYIKRKLNEDFYPPPTTTTATINGMSSSELGLLPFHSTSGNYGLHTTAGSIFGKLVHVSDAGRTDSHFGCGEAIANVHEIPKNDESWIALIERGHCSFFRKIKLAQKNNASAVIFYDNKIEDVPRINTLGTRIVSVIMGKLDGHRVAKVINGNAMVMAHLSVRTDPTPDPFMVSNIRSAQESTTRGAATTYQRTSITTILLFALTVVFYYRFVTS